MVDRKRKAEEQLQSDKLKKAKTLKQPLSGKTYGSMQIGMLFPNLSHYIFDLLLKSPHATIFKNAVQGAIAQHHNNIVMRKALIAFQQLLKLIKSNKKLAASIKASSSRSKVVALPETQQKLETPHDKTIEDLMNNLREGSDLSRELLNLADERHELQSKEIALIKDYTENRIQVGKGIDTAVNKLEGVSANDDQVENLIQIAEAPKSVETKEILEKVKPEKDSAMHKYIEAHKGIEMTFADMIKRLGQANDALSQGLGLKPSLAKALEGNFVNAYEKRCHFDKESGELVCEIKRVDGLIDKNLERLQEVTTNIKTGLKQLVRRNVVDDTTVKAAKAAKDLFEEVREGINEELKPSKSNQSPS